MIVEDEVKKSKIEEGTMYLLSNSYAAQYWLPMRKGDVVKITSEEIFSDAAETQIRISTRRPPKVQESQQLSLFDDLEDNS